MTRCPHCQAELPTPQGSTCPACGKSLHETVRYTREEREQVERGPLPLLDDAGSEAETPPAGPTATDTFDSDPGSEYAYAPYESDPTATATFSGDEDDGYAAADMDSPFVVPGSDETAAEDEIRSLWSDAVADESRPDSRLKPTAESISARTHVTVKEKTLSPPGKQDVPGADFELLSVLGEGGMGTVYEARQASVDRTIAVKMIKPHLSANAKQRDKFLAEAAVTGELDHPNIVPVHDLGASEDGVLYYAMKRVRGTPWSDVMATRSLTENLEILLRTADAVAFAHAKGVIHRDLKPQNIMLGEFGETLVMDWGLAASVSDQGKAPPLSRATAAGGTPAYMAPEMALADVEKIGFASDIYLIGAILFEIITGSRPHSGKKVLDCLIAASANKITPTAIEGELIDIAYTAMATEPEDRYPTIKAFQQAIREYQSHAESAHLQQQAAGDLQQARASRSYEEFAQAVYGMRQALKLWQGNQEARTGLADACLAYAECAFANGDLDLAASLLDPADPRHAELLERVETARKERVAKQQRLTLLTRAAVGLGATVIVILSISTVLIRRERNKAVQAQQDEATQRRIAEQEKENALQAQLAEAQQRELAERQRQIAEAQSKKALAASQAEREQRLVAEKQRQLAEEQRRLALTASEKAKEAEERAVEALRSMMIARSQEEEARAKADAARIMATKAQTELARSGMLLDNTWWTFDAKEAKARQAKAAEEYDLPATRTVGLPGDVALSLVLIPPGEFVMGSPPEEQRRAGVEYLHRVKISHPFYMAPTEFTEAQWLAATGKPPPNVTDRAPQANLPANEVSYTQIQEILLPALNKHAPEGFVFSLPTEAEWEYACRAGTHEEYNVGADENALSQAGWYLFNSERKVNPVSGKAPNAWGLYDMHGNVSEWCRDMYDAGWYVRSPVDDPVREGTVPQRVVRGGGCLNLPQHCRSAYRSWAHTPNRYKFLGLRVVLRKTESP